MIFTKQELKNLKKLTDSIYTPQELNEKLVDSVKIKDKDTELAKLATDIYNNSQEVQSWYDYYKDAELKGLDVQLGKIADIIQKVSRKHSVDDSIKDKDELLTDLAQRADDYGYSLLSKGGRFYTFQENNNPNENGFKEELDELDIKYITKFHPSGNLILIEKSSVKEY